MEHPLLLDFFFFFLCCQVGGMSGKIEKRVLIVKVIIDSRRYDFISEILRRLVKKFKQIQFEVSKNFA